MLGNLQRLGLGLGLPYTPNVGGKVDPLAGFFNVFYGRTSYGVVVPDAGGLGSGYSTQNLSGIDLLYQTIGSPIPSGTPANLQSQAIAALYDPTTTIGQAGAVQSNPTFQPTADWIQDSVTLLWKPSMSFNGVNQYLATPGNVGITGAQPFTLFIVAKTNNISAIQHMAGFGNPSNVIYAGIFEIFGGWWLAFGSGNVFSSTPATINWNVHCISYDEQM